MLCRHDMTDWPQVTLACKDECALRDKVVSSVPRQCLDQTNSIATQNRTYIPFGWGDTAERSLNANSTIGNR
jgi:hypothetical protein